MKNEPHPGHPLVWLPAALLGVGLLGAFPVRADIPSIPYRMKIEGVEDAALRRKLDGASDTRRRIDRPPLTETQLQRQARGDIGRFTSLLQSEGYYGARVELEIDVEPDPARVRFRVDTGRRYRLRRIQVESLDEYEGAPAPPAPEEAGLTPGMHARARTVLQAEQRLGHLGRQRGHPWARVESKEVRVEHAQRAMDVVFRYRAGPSARFGEVRIDGLDRVRSAMVHRKIPWQEGDPYNIDLEQTARRRLSETALFTIVRVRHAPELEADGRLPMHIELSERRHRTIGLGAGYRSDEGLGAQLGWEHRNLRGAGEHLRFELTASEIGRTGEARFSRPDFRRIDQTLSVTLHGGVEHPDAFRSTTAGVRTDVDRRLTAHRRVSAGLGYKYAAVRDGDDRIRQRYGLLYLPLAKRWDRSDDLLDPHRGWRGYLGVTPYQDLLGSDLSFLRLRASVTRYTPLRRTGRLGWANRLVFGSLVGASRSRVPADERFYAGGGGSIRGYAYQSVGELDNRTPLGGNSLGLVSSELRWRFRDPLGVVVFLDGGGAFRESVPEFGEEWRWGAGLGLRYHSPIGPVRIDAASPLNRREDVDDRVHVYVSIGQAF